MRYSKILFIGHVLTMDTDEVSHARLHIGSSSCGADDPSFDTRLASGMPAAKGSGSIDQPRGPRGS